MKWFLTWLPLLTACSANSMMDADPGEGPAPDEAKVVVYRPSDFNRNRWYYTYDGEKFIGLAQPLRFFEYRCPPGRHLFILHAVTDAAVEADLAPGKTYYLKAEAKPDWLTLRLLLTPVTEGSEEMESLLVDLDNCSCVAPIPEKALDYNAEELLEALERKDYFEGAGKGECRLLRPEDGR